MMFASERLVGNPDAVPFGAGEEAWFWTIGTLQARRDGAGAGWLPAGPVRPCEPDDVIKCLNSLYERRAVSLLHARVLKDWGERQQPPRDGVAAEARDHRLWQQAMARLEWALRGRGIVG